MKPGLWQRVLDLLMPRRCPFCGAVVDRDLPCDLCQRQLPWLIGAEAEGRVEFVDGFASALRYQGEVAKCVRVLKFHRRLGGINTLALLTAQCASDHFAGSFDLVTWVPLSPKSLRARGFDQSELLAQAVAKAAGLEPVSLFVKRNGVTRQSSLHGVAARRGNVLGAYTLKTPELAAGQRVLVVDDVITTGATLSECARLLWLAGAKQVWGVSLARGNWGIK